jgi:acyl-CoA synthetase (AMP-forming)/AMP-acid ligase II
MRVRLEDYQLDLIGEVAAISESALAAVFGRRGPLLRARARGIDPRPVAAEPAEAVSFSNEETFARDISDRADLHARLRSMADGLADGLQRRGMTARTVTTKLRYPDFAIVTRSQSLEVGIDDAETIGEVVMQGNNVMKGYFADDAATAEAFRGGWFHSGDLGVMHPDGYIELRDRAKDIIISGGENVSSLEVEEALYRHPAVLEAAVVAMPDGRFGERPCAFVTLKPDAAADEAGIVAWCREHLAHYKAPARVVFGPLPKTSTGKIQKFELRERAKQGSKACNCSGRP